MRRRPFGYSSQRTAGADAVITGAGSGIGRAFAVELARRGGRVVCADLDPVRAKETAELINRGTGRAHHVECDVRDVEQVCDLADAARDLFGSEASLVINNAGIGAGGTVIGEMPLADWRRTIDVNLWGVIYGCQVFVPRLRTRGTGGVINVASAASFAAAPRMAAYNVSKAGVLALSQTLAAELSGTGITVTVVCPTFVKTNIVDNGAIEGSAARLAARLMQRSGVSAESVAVGALDAHDRGRLHVLPQRDAKLIWHAKRLLPGSYTRALGLVERIAR